ncbi:MAG: hypothetical protein ABIJ09_25585 [Pseudomonadota bacterium]
MKLKIQPRYLEVHKGHDGLLRGKPEPAVVLCVLGEAGDGMKVLAKETLRFRLGGELPGRAELETARTLRVERIRSEGQLVLLTAGIEEDSGEGIGQVCAAFEFPDRVQVLTQDQRLVQLGDRRELETNLNSGVAETLAAVFFEGREMTELCRGDDWVGCSVLRLVGLKGPLPAQRFNVTSEHNHWTLIVDVFAQR